MLFTVVGADLREEPPMPQIMFFDADNADHAYEQYVDAIAQDAPDDVLVIAIYRGYLVDESHADVLP